MGVLNVINMLINTFVTKKTLLIVFNDLNAIDSLVGSNLKI